MSERRISFCAKCQMHMMKEDKLACAMGWKVGNVTLPNGKVLEGVNTKWVARDVQKNSPNDDPKKAVKVGECPDYVAIDQKSSPTSSAS